MEAGREDMSRRQLIGAAAVGATAVIGATATAADASGGRFKGKIALVTGAAQGIGRETAVAFAKQGADIALCDICEQSKVIAHPMGSEAKMAETKRLVEAEGRKCLAVKADVRDLKQMKEFVGKVVTELGHVDFVVANAGVAVWGLLADITDDQWRAVTLAPSE